MKTFTIDYTIAYYIFENYKIENKRSVNIFYFNRFDNIRI